MNSDLVMQLTLLIFVVPAIAALTDSSSTGFTLEQGIPHFNTNPYFLIPSTYNFSALEGQSAYLHCRVAQLGDKKLSWIRRRDLHVLTSELHTFASDDRFQALHQERSENWTLHIRFSQIRDSGEYQCQVNTEPRISLTFYLNVRGSATSITGSPQRYVKAGSEIRLSCNTSTSSPPPGLLYWYQNADLIQNDDRTTVSTSFRGIVTSQLEIQKATRKDSGNYTCWPTKFQPASVTIHVITEEEPAAMSHGTLSGSSRNDPSKSPAISTEPPILATHSGTVAHLNTFCILYCCIFIILVVFLPSLCTRLPPLR